MKIFSWNVNGLRSAYKKGFLNWLEKSRGDIVCLQEIKVQPEQLPSDLIHLKSYHSHFNPAFKKGYSGVAVYSQQKPLKMNTKLGLERFDQEGRFLELEYPDFTFINLYLPHGGREKEHLNYKLKAYNFLINFLKQNKNKAMILAGDFNIAHQEIDLARSKENKNNIMFTSLERKQIDELVKLGFVDTFRKFNQDGGHYTWWPYGFKARERNLGWRIDYIFASQELIPKVVNAFILPDVTGSDHCPVGLEMAF